MSVLAQKERLEPPFDGQLCDVENLPCLISHVREHSQNRPTRHPTLPSVLFGKGAGVDLKTGFTRAPLAVVCSSPPPSPRSDATRLGTATWPTGTGRGCRLRTPWWSKK